MTVVAFFALGSTSPVNDLQRAKTQVPRSEFRGDTFAEMGDVLNKHLRNNFARVEDCSNFRIEDLQVLQIKLFQWGDPLLAAIYREAKDNRRERHHSVAALQLHQQRLVDESPAEVMPMLRDALCHEVVMRFVHHTTDAVKKSLAGDLSVKLPTLPTHQYVHDGDPRTLAAFQEYSTATGCQACHSRLVPLPSPQPSARCNAQLSFQCGKRGQLLKSRCDECVAQHALALNACEQAESIAWCDHGPACTGAEECPVWPTEFAAPFTLHATIPHISASTSTFYYKYDSEMQVQTVDYIEKCFPFVNVATAFHNLPCKLFFNPQGIYLSQPGRVDCCLFVKGVGAAPPEFLQSFTLKARDQDAPDMYGNQVKCDEWEGPEGFRYWTVGKNDPLYKNFGHDIVFQDGPTGVTWRWGNFSALPAGDHFSLPAGQCSTPCSVILEAAEIEALHVDAHVKKTMAHHVNRAAAATFLQ